MEQMQELAREILQELDVSYMNGECQLAEDLEIGERGDTLADFIHITVREQVAKFTSGQLPGILEAISSELNSARDNLLSVSKALEGLDEGSSLDEILRSANQGYKNGAKNLSTELPQGVRGDVLADFIVAELKDVCVGSQNPVEEAIQAMQRAEEDLFICEGVLVSMSLSSPRPQLT